MDDAPLLKTLYLDFYFFICLNDLLDKLTSNPKLFANETSLFPTVTNQINNDLHNIIYIGLPMENEF